MTPYEDMTMTRDNVVVVEDGSARYMQTEYLKDFQHRLRTDIVNLVRWEVKQYGEYLTKLRSNALYIPKNEDERRVVREAQFWLENLPDQLWSSGVKIVGPRHLPRGETTSLYMTLSGGRNRWVVGYFEVYTDLDGRWDLSGYASNRSRISVFGNEIVEPVRDDLAHIAGWQPGGLLGQLDTAFTRYLQFSQESMPSIMGIGRQQKQSAQQASQASQAPQPVAAPSAFPERMRERTTNLVRGQPVVQPVGRPFAASAAAPVAPVANGSAQSGAYSAESIKGVLEQHRPVAAWYSELSSSVQPAQRDLYQRFLAAAANWYPAIIKSTLISSEIWFHLNANAANSGFAVHRCKAFGKPVDVDSRHGCVLLAGGCPKAMPASHSTSICHHQQMRPASGV